MDNPKEAEVRPDQKSDDFSSKAYLDMELLRFTTAGSVDDGKSTLIGRLLYDSKSIFEDQLEAVKRASIHVGGEEINLALLTDGLRDERIQGITIDVAYRYFATPRRKFIIADTPGHVQYTRNMVTGASTANLALVLVDARHGVVEQTRRHAFIASLLRIPHLVLCINKMDLVDYSEEVYEAIKREFSDFAGRLDIKDTRFIPISALEGDNVVDRSHKTPWYDGPTLLYLLETIYIASDHNFDDSRLPIQWVNRPQTTEYHDYRGYAGRVASGTFRVGDEVIALPSGLNSKIKSIDVFEGTAEEVYPPMAVSIQLEDDIDLGRGDMIVETNNPPTVGQDIELKICWFNERPMQLGGKYSLKHTTQEARCVIKDVVHKVDINKVERITGDKSVRMNEIARIKIRTTKPLFYDSYKKNRVTGSLILIDEATNETVAAGMIV